MKTQAIDEKQGYARDESEFSFTLECTKSISWRIFLDTNTLIFSDNFETMYGICQADYNYRFDRFLDLHLKAHKEQILESIDLYFSGETDCAAIGEITLSDDKRNMNWLNANGKCVGGNQKLIYGVSVDITQHKEVEQELSRKYEDEWSKAIDELKKAIYGDGISRYIHLFVDTVADNALPPSALKTYGYAQLMSKLSRREQEIIGALLDGNVNYKDLSNALHISPNTVKTHLRHIYQTTGVPNIPALLSLLHSSGKC